MMQSVQRYNKTTIILHWLIGLLLLAMLALGFWMSGLPKDLPEMAAVDLFELGIYTLQLSEPMSPRAFYFNLHKSIGSTLFLLILFRVFWRLRHAAPEFPASMPVWEKKLAAAVHHVLYLLMLALPVTGLLMTLYSKYGLLWFGIKVFEGLDMPQLRDAFKEAHEIIAISLLTLIVLHVLAAFKHKWLDKDTVMSRMTLKG